MQKEEQEEELEENRDISFRELAKHFDLQQLSEKKFKMNVKIASRRRSKSKK